MTQSLEIKVDHMENWATAVDPYTTECNLLQLALVQLFFHEKIVCGNSFVKYPAAPPLVALMTMVLNDCLVDYQTLQDNQATIDRS